MTAGSVLTQDVSRETRKLWTLASSVGCPQRCLKAYKKEEVEVVIFKEEQVQVVEEIGKGHGEVGIGTTWIEGRSR